MHYIEKAAIVKTVPCWYNNRMEGYTMDKHIGETIARRRKSMNMTQLQLAQALGISAQAVSKWENGSASPDVYLLPQIAGLLNTSVDALFGYKAAPQTEYEERYSAEDYYWGLVPSSLCYEALRLLPPVKPLRVLDIGCGEGKDAVFFARNGYAVSAFDVAESGLNKGRSLAAKCGVHINFFRADVNDFVPEEKYDIIFSSGVFHYIHPEKRVSFIESLKNATNPGGLNLINAFVEKPFIAPPPDSEKAELENRQWKSGELFTGYHDWLLHKTEEKIFDCMSSNQPHKHCMDIVIAQKP